ncbi:hypothetical protein DPMN_128919 [Dreissena polymorpha]|uniref:Uncharacterized protein n=1 Tax=Dreissena polymorpha TaxID=45954 RepID=A0A9D4H4U3_DREPO|nr:hypothetical protein DPMN_128919 [Dreissena polymorpha]
MLARPAVFCRASAVKAKTNGPMGLERDSPAITPRELGSLTVPARPLPGYSRRSPALRENQPSVQESRARKPGQRDEARETTTTEPVILLYLFNFSKLIEKYAL